MATKPVTATPAKISRPCWMKSRIRARRPNTSRQSSKPLLLVSTVEARSYRRLISWKNNCAPVREIGMRSALSQTAIYRGMAAPRIADASGPVSTKLVNLRSSLTETPVNVRDS